MSNNVEAIESLIKFMYNNMQYAEFNTRSDYCSKCGFEGEIRSNENGEWECPHCHNTDVRYMSISRRTCGYIGTAEAGWNDGKMQEFNERVLHLY